MTRLKLRAIYALDRLRFARFLRRWRGRLELSEDVSPNLRLVDLRIEPGGTVRIARGFAAERAAGNHLWAGAGARIELGERCWLRVECGDNRIRAFPGARISVGRDALINAAMLHAKAEITIGDDCLLGFGARIIDADLHPLDRETPERVAPVRIGDRVWIGSDTTVLRGVTIGDDVVVGARSVVTRDLPPRVLAAGAPARVLREIAPRAGAGAVV